MRTTVLERPYVQKTIHDALHVTIHLRAAISIAVALDTVCFVLTTIDFQTGTIHEYKVRFILPRCSSRRRQLESAIT